MKKIVITLYSLMFLLPALLYAQDHTAQLIDWKMLAHVTYEDHYFEEYEAWYVKPVFPEKIQKLDGRKVIIKGYIIPIDLEGGIYALSAYPFSACFFCGGAGPESVMSLKFKAPPRKFKTDDVVTLAGQLHLNDSDVDDFSYVLMQAEELNP